VRRYERLVIDERLCWRLQDEKHVLRVYSSTMACILRAKLFTVESWPGERDGWSIGWL